MVMDQVEELGAGNPKHAAVMRVRTGVTRDGHITAHLQEMYFDSGAYAGLMPLGALAGVDRIAANWRIPNARFEQYHVYTNNLAWRLYARPGRGAGLLRDGVAPGRGRAPPRAWTRWSSA